MKYFAGFSRQLSLSALALVLPAVSQATSITLPPPSGVNAVLYGDFYSYSLPVLALQYAKQNGGSVGPGNPFYVDSSAGQIKDDVVVATGANGAPVNTNGAGFNDAYQTPNGNGGLSYFSTGQTNLHPTGSGGLSAAADQNTTWNASLAAMTSYLGGSNNLLNSLVFMFNNNEINSGGGVYQNLLVWAQISLRDIDGGAATKYYTFANNCPAGNVCLSGGVVGSAGGILIGLDKDPTLYSRGAADNAYPVAPASGSTPALSDFVISGGKVCMNAVGNVVQCNDPGVTDVLNHNLGANQAAYAVVSQELDQELNSWWNGGLGYGSAYDVISVDFRMGCNPRYVTSCTNGQMIDNGYEQLFIISGLRTPQDVPAPNALALLGIGLLSLTAMRRRH